MLVDTHCHLADPVLAAKLSDIIEAGKMAGVLKFIVPGIEPEEWKRINLLQRSLPEVFPAYGLHPMHAGKFGDKIIEELESLAPSAVAIGEIGLDYTLEQVPRLEQISSFRSQLRLARKLDLPVVLHCRKAFQDLFKILEEEKILPIRGVMHAFSGSVETAEKCVKMGLYISIAGSVTFSNAVKPVTVVEKIPLQYLLLETDAPDLTPEPYRGQHNQPAFLVATARKIAGIKGISLQNLADTTTMNAIKLFRLQ